MKESVADRVRRFKENSPRLNVQTRRLPEENFELTPLSSCGSVDDILAVLRARATESVQQTSTDLSEILHDIRTSSSEISRLSEPCVDERQKVKALLKRLSLESENLKPPDDDPAAVLARIKERLKMESCERGEKGCIISDPQQEKAICVVSYRQQETKSCVVSDPVILSPSSTTKPEWTSSKTIVQIPRSVGIDEEIQTELASGRKEEKLSLVSVLVDDQTWIGEGIITKSKKPALQEQSRIKSLATDRDWRRYIQTEVERTRAAIYDRIKAERYRIHF